MAAVILHHKHCQTVSEWAESDGVTTVTIIDPDIGAALAWLREADDARGTYTFIVTRMEPESYSIIFCFDDPDTALFFKLRFG